MGLHTETHTILEVDASVLDKIEAELAKAGSAYVDRYCTSNEQIRKVYFGGEVALVCKKKKRVKGVRGSLHPR